MENDCAKKEQSNLSSIEKTLLAARGNLHTIDGLLSYIEYGPSEDKDDCATKEEDSPAAHMDSIMRIAIEIRNSTQTAINKINAIKSG